VTLANFLGVIRSRYPESITNSYQERKCRLQLGGIPASSLVAIHGTLYQKHHPTRGKLADRTIFSARRDGFICALELKGGDIGSVSAVKEQLQRGLDLAASVLDDWQIRSWYPLLLFGGRLHREDIRQLALPENRVRFLNERRLIQYRRCGTTLSEVLSS
jgi:hypothetical protein